MNTFAPRCISLTILLAALCGPTGAQAQAPVASNNSITTVSGAQQEIYLYQSTTWSVAGSYDSRLTYSVVKQPSNGVVTWASSYSPYANYYCIYQCTNLSYVGQDSFVWRCAYGSQTSGLATCSISVSAPVAPTATSFSVTTTPGAGLSAYNFGAFATIPDVDSGLQVTYSFVTLPTNGTIFFTYGAHIPYLTYTPNSGFVGTDSLLWNVGVGSMTSATAKCTINVPANTAPTAQTCSFTVPSGVTVTNTMPYTDPDSGQTWTAIVTSQPAHGSAWLDAGGGVKVDYCSAPGFAGTDTFSFAISDGMSISTPATCTMTVTSAPPAALAQTVVTKKNTPITIPLAYSGGGGYTGWPVRVTSPNPGTLSTNGGIFVYTPQTNWVSPATPDYFTWQMAYKTNGGAVLLTTAAKCSIVVKDVGGNTNCDWTQWRFDECHTAQSPATLPGKLYLQWKLTLPASAGAFDGASLGYVTPYWGLDSCRPVQMGKQLFVPCLANDSMSAYKTETGGLNWRYYASGVIRRPPVAVALTNGLNGVIFGSDDGFVYCLNVADGSEIWKFRAAPNSKKAMGFGRLSSCWPVWSSPLVYSNRVYFAAGYVPSWNLFTYCLDVTSGNVIWKNDGLTTLNDGHNSALGPLTFSLDHTQIFGTRDHKLNQCGWIMSPVSGQIAGYFNGTTPGSPKQDNFCQWFVYQDMYSAIKTLTVEPQTLTAGAQTFTPANVAALGVPVTYTTFQQNSHGGSYLATASSIGSMLAGDGKLFVTTTNWDIYCFGGSNVTPTIYPLASTPLPPITDAWTTVVQNMLAGRPDLGQGLALVWGVGSGRLVEELSKQAPGLSIVACDPDTNKLYRLRAEMDAAGWSGARVMTVRDNPLNAGFAPYQAALIASEDLTVAGYSNGMAFAKMLYKCTRPFGGQIWLPAATAQYNNMVAWLSALSLPTCGGNSSYSVSQTSNFGVTGIDGFCCMQRLGLPDVNLDLKPPFRLTAFGTLGSMSPEGNPVKGTMNGAYDWYSWLPLTAGEPGYEPFVPLNAYNSEAWSGVIDTLPLMQTSILPNKLFSSRLEASPHFQDEVAQPGFRSGCGPNRLYRNMAFNPNRGYAIGGDSSNYWGVLPFADLGTCTDPQNTMIAGNGSQVLQGDSSCSCSGMNLMQFGITASDDPDEEQWVRYSVEPSNRPVQETPIQAIGINFGAPGERWDDADQLLWAHHPLFGTLRSAKMNSPYDPNVEPKPLIPVTYRGGTVTNIYHYSGNGMSTTNSDPHPWVAASHVEGMTGITVPLAHPLVAVRAATPPVMDGMLTDACWQACTQILLQTATDCTTNGQRSYCMVCYDATNLYVAGVMHQPLPWSRPGTPAQTPPAHMKVAINSRENPLPPSQVPLLYNGEYGWTNSAVTPPPFRRSVGLATNAWSGAYTTNREVFMGEIAIPWASLAAAGIWTSQLVMNVEVCGDFLNGNGNWAPSSLQFFADDTFPGVALENYGVFNYFGSHTLYGVLQKYLSPVFFDTARGPQAQVTPHTVRLYFAETEGWTHGQRVFDVKLQGQTVLTNLDVYAAGGGAYREVVEAFTNIGIADSLNVDFVPHTTNAPPMLSGIAIINNGAYAANLPPVAVLTASTASGPAPLSVQFSAQASVDPDGQIVECAWDTGDGRVARGSILNHVYTQPGTYTNTLLVMDNDGAIATASQVVTVTAGVSAAPAAFICNIRSTISTNAGTGGDYTTLQSWGTAMADDLTSQSMIFNVSSKGTIAPLSIGWPYGFPVTFSGGNTGVLVWLNTYVTNNITNMLAEVACVGGTGTVSIGSVVCWASQTFTIGDTGTVAKSMLFTVAATNSYLSAKDDNQIVVFSGGGMGILKHINHTVPQLACITGCRGKIQTGTVTCASSGDTFVIADTGHSLYTIVAACYNDWPNGLNSTTTLPDGWITDPNHCAMICSAAGQGHAGTIRNSTGIYAGFTLIAPLTTGFTPYTRIQNITIDNNNLFVGPCSSVNRVLSSVTLGAGPGYFNLNGNGSTIANSIGAMFSITNPGAYASCDVHFFNCTGGSFLLGDMTALRIRAINCLAYSNSVGFTANTLCETWLNHCVSQDNSANNWDNWKDGNVGNRATQTVSFISVASNNYLLAASDTGARGLGQPGLGADVAGNLRTGPRYDVGAHQTTNALTAYQQWLLANNLPLSTTTNSVNNAGISYNQLYLSGANPNDSNTWFRFTSLAPILGNNWGMNFNTVSSKLYTVYWKTNLLDEVGWQYYTNFQGLGGSTQVIFTNPLPQAFFQIQAQ